MNVKTLGDRGSKVKKIGKRNLKMALLSRERLKNCYKFTFIRDPFSRVLSAYLDKIETGKTKFRNDLDINDRELSFLEFLKLLDDGYLTSNIHWAPQAYVVPQHPSKLDFIGRVENLEADLQEVMTHIFGNDGHKVVQSVTGVTSASSRVNEFYGDQERLLVRKMYARDFELFYPNT